MPHATSFTREDGKNKNCVALFMFSLPLCLKSCGTQAAKAFGIRLKKSWDSFVIRVLPSIIWQVQLNGFLDLLISRITSFSSRNRVIKNLPLRYKVENKLEAIIG